MTEKKKKSAHLTFEERQTIETLLDQGMSRYAIAKLLKKEFGTVSREIARFPGEKYSAIKAQNDYKLKTQRDRRKQKIIFSDQQEEQIRLMMKDLKSRREIAKAMGCSIPTINRWVLENNPSYPDQRRNTFKNRNSGINLSDLDRLSNLEQQVEIILQIIEELHAKNN
jgi:IS30 family transposase